MSDVALINQDDESTVAVLAGAIAGSHLYDGRITEYASSDRVSRQNGTLDMPERFTLSGILTADAAAIEDALVEAKAAATSLSISIPNRAPVPNMQIERVSFDIDSTRGVPFSIDFKERRSASSRTVTLEPLRRSGARDGGPREELAPGLADEDDLGSKPISLIEAGRRAILAALP
jgi:hypothetical protein